MQRVFEDERTTEEACLERCEEENLDSHPTAKRARVSEVFSDSRTAEKLNLTTIDVNC